MSQAIKNALNAFAYYKVSAMLEDSRHVTPALLDQWEVELHGTMKEEGQKIGKTRIRELVVAYLLSEFGIKAFGVEPIVVGVGEISESTIRKMKNQRKKGFRDVKAVKAAK